MNSASYKNHFKPGLTYRHVTGKDLDIYIVRIRYSDAKRAKLLIWWVSQTTGQPVMINGKLTDNVEIKAEDYQYWSVLKKKVSNEYTN